MLIKLSDESTVVASHHDLVYLSSSKLQAIYTPTFRVYLLPISQLGRTGALTAFGRGHSLYHRLAESQFLELGPEIYML